MFLGCWGSGTELGVKFLLGVGCWVWYRVLIVLGVGYIVGYLVFLGCWVLSVCWVLCVGYSVEC